MKANVAGDQDRGTMVTQPKKPENRPATTSATPNRVEMIQFTLGDRFFCTRMEGVRQIQAESRLSLSLEAEDEPHGWIRAGNRKIPVIHGARKLNLPESRRPGSRQVILMNVGPSLFGLLIDRVMRVFHTDPRAIHPLPSVLRTGTADLFDGLLFRDGEWMFSLAPHLIWAPGGEKPQSLQPQTTPTPAPARHGQPTGLVQFRIGQHLFMKKPLKFGLSLSQVAEIFQQGTPTPIPTAHPHLLGLIHWREKPLPFVDLNRRLGIPSGQLRDRRTLVARLAPNDYMAFTVASDVRIVHEPFGFEPFLRKIKLHPALAGNIFEGKAEMLIMPDLETLVFN